MDIVLKIIQVILALSLLIVVHEFGHFIFARIFKIRVEKFYLFFPPAIVKYKPRKSDTEWGIGCIPLGGFCKISGMIDESMDKDQMSKEPQPWEFRTKPAWQRLLVMVGGVLFNFILAIVLYSAILFTWGEEYLKNEDAVFGVEVNPLAYEIGFRNGDRILSFDGEPIASFTDLQMDLARSQAKSALVLRGSDTITVNIDPAYIPAILNTPGMFMLSTPVAVSSVPDTSINASAGLMKGDRFLSINSVEVSNLSSLQAELGKVKGETAMIAFLRDGKNISIPIKVDGTGRIQILLQNDISDLNITEKKYSLLTCIPAGFTKTFKTIGNYVKELGLIFSPKTEAYKSVGSFIAIGSIFPSTWNWQIFWNITAWLSIMLAVLNILPIPALDGGHILFTLYEIITGKKPSDKFLEYAQIVGMIILLGLVFLAFGNDIYRLFK